MRRILLGFLVLGCVSVTTAAWAIVADTNFVPTDQGKPIPSATVTITVTAPARPAARPKPPVRVTARSDGRVARRIDVDPNDRVTVTVQSGSVTYTSGEIPVSRLTSRGEIPVTPTAFAPPGTAGGPPGFDPPPIYPGGPALTFSAGGMSTVCDNFNTTGVVVFDFDEILGDPRSGCGSSGFRGGIGLGYSRVFAQRWLAGIEGEFGLSTSKNTFAGIPGTVNGALTTPTLSARDSVTMKEDWDAAVRGRIGYFVAPTWLLYATGGVAFQHVDATVNCSAAGTCSATNIGLTPFSATASDTMVGWVLGGGIETRLFGDFWIRGEYRYADYGTFTARFGTPTNLLVVSDIRMRTHTGTASLVVPLGRLFNR